METRAHLVRMIRRLPAIAVLLGLAVLPQIGTADDRPKPARRLGAPEHIDSATQAELTARMGRHGETMSNLVRAVVLLDRRTIRGLASRIADDEVIARSSKSVHEPPPLPLPGEFFLQQTKLAVAARDLAAAATDGGDDRILADRFANLTSTCVSCHSAYLRGRPDPRPLGAKPDTNARSPR